MVRGKRREKDKRHKESGKRQKEGGARGTRREEHEAQRGRGTLVSYASPVVFWLLYAEFLHC